MKMKLVGMILSTGILASTLSYTLNDINVVEAKSSDNTKKYAVSFVKHVDGDTVKVKRNGKELTLRLLLIDTPETVHPKLGSQPFGKTASNYTKSLVSKGQKLSIEYDNGAKTDKYGRHLVYLYSNGKSVQKSLLNKGYARVGYIYEQKRYLNQYKKEEAIAKKSKRGIWSKPGYVNIKGEGYNTTKVKNTTTQTTKPIYVPVPNISKPINNSNTNSRVFSNCTELKSVYPKGVYKTHPAYQSKMDRDKDGYACES